MTKLDFLYAIIILGAFQGLLIGLTILFKTKGSNVLKFLLSSILILLSVRFIIYPFDFSNYVNSPILGVLSTLSLLTLILVAPLTYLYVRTKLHSYSKLKWFDILHTLPFIYYCVHVFIYPITLPISFCYAPWVLGILYGIISVTQILKSDNQGKNFSNLKPFPYILLIISSLVIIIDQANVHFSLFNTIDCALIPYLLLTILFYVMGYKFMTNSKEYLDRLINIPINNNGSIDPKKVKHLTSLVENERLFLDPQLNLNMLADHIGYTRHETSNIINVGLEKTFNQLINEYRIETAKKKLTDPKSNHLSIMGIAQESGFKSKSTFIRYFKELVGSTPSEYLQKVRK